MVSHPHIHGLVFWSAGWLRIVFYLRVWLGNGAECLVHWRRIKKYIKPVSVSLAAHSSNFLMVEH